ncbi:hypothetical protein BPTFM16_02672 [Altererythrobacter insulae]|nr:hypothetical protein BPTFM16_02672 [Altererythrobacter insulae]
MKLKYLLAASVVSLSAAATVATPAAAQTITSGVEGQVADETGAAIPGATVTVTDTRTGQTRTLTAGTDGNFRVGSLVPGGPYTVTATAPGYEGQTVENQFINLSGNTSYSFNLASTAAGASDNVIIVTGARVGATQLAVGPGVAFDQQTLEAFPSLTRDVRDIIRIDPRVSLEQNNDVDRISCLGGNDRTNTFTVDGIVQSDVFGLNGTPFAARNSLPLPFDVIDQISVEFAPFDVEYSEFTGCLINVVTESGGNEFSGSAFFTYFDGGLFADEIDGRPLTANEEKRWGATLNGPIIKDRLFFAFGYEEADLSGGNNFGPAGGGFTNEADFVSQAQFDEFARIARDVYGQDVGGYPRSLPEGNVRYFGRLDAILTDDHRVEATYQRLEETNIESDFGGSNLTGFNSFEDEGTTSDYYSVRLYSDWSDSISTELRLSRAEVGDVQGPVGFGEAQSENPTPRLVVGVMPDGTQLSDGGVTDNNGILSTGPGIFRSANQLDTKIDQARFQLNYDAGSGHFLKFGVEYNDLEVFNLFAINATGSLYFQNFADFEAGLLSPGTEFFPNADEVANGEAYGGDINAAIDGDINNAAASFSRQIYSFYAQDEWQATDQLTVNAGMRVQIYDGDAPTANPNFLERYGFTNANSFARIDPVWLPRLSATYEFDNEGFFSNSRLTGGVGIFSGGDPVVYYSNAFSNNGFSSALGTTRFDCGAGDIAVDPVTGQFDVVTGGQFTGFPQCAIDGGAADAAAGLADVQSTNPDFKVPTVTRASLAFQTDIGTETGFFSNWNLQLDYIYSRFNNALNFVDLSQTPDIRQGINGFTVDGRPIYQAIDNTEDGCNAVLQGNGGTPPVYTGVTAECFDTRRDDNIQLTNDGGSNAHSISAVLRKRFESGLLTDGGSTSVTLGYAFTDSNNARNNQSSTATSSFDVTAAFDRQDPAVSTATTETRHNFTAAVNFREQFIDGYDTSFGFFFRAREGRPYSLTFDGGGVFADSSSGNDNALLYVPSGLSDPNLSPDSDPTAVQQVIDYVNASGCKFTPGATIERNTCRNDWHIDLDLRFSQELPFLGSLTGIKEDRIEVFADFANFLNLLDSGANILKSRGGFNGLVSVADADVDDEGRYVIDDFNPDDQNFIAINPSAWRIQVGVRYEF